ncbi:MAG: PDZ domain-containing protein [Wenzhouxiangellaceae bacterium]|nr:PDZ domain-containing protein [Wenzhouxiangellaceae bacterium]
MNTKTHSRISFGGALATALAFALAIPAFAQDRAESDRAAAAVERAETEAERGATREQLDAARRELAEAARKLAALQRELAEADGASHFVWHSHEDGEGFAPEVDVQRIRTRIHEAMTGMPPRIGVLLGPADDEGGYRIVGVTPGGGAEEAGIRTDDVLVAIDGNEIETSRPGSVRELMARVEAGDVVEVTVRRDGEPRTFEVETRSMGEDVKVLVERFAPEDFLADFGERLEREIVIHAPDGARPPMPPLPPLPPRMSALGHNSDLVTNHDGLADYFGTGEGVLVLRIAEDNAFGLLAGDVVLQVDGQDVARPVDLGRQLMGREVGDRVTLTVMRAGTRMELAGEIPERAEHRVNERSIGLHAPTAPPAPAAPDRPAPPAPVRPL